MVINLEVFMEIQVGNKVEFQTIKNNLTRRGYGEVKKGTDSHKREYCDLSKSYKKGTLLKLAIIAVILFTGGFALLALIPPQIRETVGNWWAGKSVVHLVNTEERPLVTSKTQTTADKEFKSEEKAPSFKVWVTLGPQERLINREQMIKKFNDSYLEVLALISQNKRRIILSDLICHPPYEVAKTGNVTYVLQRMMEYAKEHSPIDQEEVSNFLPALQVFLARPDAKEYFSLIPAVWRLMALPLDTIQGKLAARQVGPEAIDLIQIQMDEEKEKKLDQLIQIFLENEHNDPKEMAAWAKKFNEHGLMAKVKAFAEGRPQSLGNLLLCLKLGGESIDTEGVKPLFRLILLENPEEVKKDWYNVIKLFRDDDEVMQLGVTQLGKSQKEIDYERLLAYSINWPKFVNGLTLEEFKKLFDPTTEVNNDDSHGCRGKLQGFLKQAFEPESFPYCAPILQVLIKEGGNEKGYCDIGYIEDELATLRGGIIPNMKLSKIDFLLEKLKDSEYKDVAKFLTKQFLKLKLDKCELEELESAFEKHKEVLLKEFSDIKDLEAVFEEDE